MRRRVAGLFAIVATLFLVYFFAQREFSDTGDIELPATFPKATQSTKATPPPPPASAAGDLRSALAEACTNSPTSSGDKEWTQEELEAQIDAFYAKMMGLSQTLSASSSAEHLHLLAAVFEDDPAKRLELLDRAISRSPSDPFLVWGAVRICSEPIQSVPCPLRDWEQLLIAVDGQNSESWIRIAANRYAAGQHGAALEALRYASTAAESRTYWTETIEMIERGLAAGSDYAFAERAGMAVSSAASQLPRYGDYIQMCEERSAQSVDWAYTCLAYGETLENQGKTEVSVAIARSIQIHSLEVLGDLDKAAKVQRRIDKRNLERLDWTKNVDPAIEKLIFSNPTLFSAYLATIRSEGEENAQRKIIEEIERLIEQRSDLTCEQVSVR